MATLKLSDLSVGDWVRCRGRNGRIECLRVIGDDERISVAVKSYLGTMYQFVDIEDIEPIPITAEILESNWFVKNGEYNEWNIGNWNDIPFIGISLSRQSMRIKNIGTDIFLENKVVYVHQLQHTLRLAGIDKEINL